VNLRVALIFGVVAMLGAYLGARLAVFVSGAVQLGLLGVVMLAAAISMLRGRAPASDAEHAGTAHVELRTLGPMLAVGLGVGVLTGLVGIGGGFLIVPALVLLARVPMKQAIGTSLLVIAMNSASGFAGYLGQAAIPWDVLALFTTVAVGGILVGTHLVRYISAGSLKRAFGVFLLAVGSLMLYQNLGAVMPSRGQEMEEAARR
jgi:uncharacterized membrane protein YfcA